MEMMVVLLIMSIIAAATAPIVSRKMTRSSGSGASPWVFTGQGKNIAFNMGGLDNATAIIGASKVPEGTKTRLYIDCGDSASQLSLGSGDQAASILADPVNKRVGIYSATSTASIPNNSIAIGMNQNWNSRAKDTIAIGMNQNVNHADSIAIGSNSSANGKSVAIGNYAKAAAYAVAIGSNFGGNAVTESAPTVASNFSVAIGSRARTDGDDSIAIGNTAIAKNKWSVAIGNYTYANDLYAIAISARANKCATGIGAEASGIGSIAIGAGGAVKEATKSSGMGSIAIGSYISDGGSSNTSASYGQTEAEGRRATAIGGGAHANYDHSTAIGCNAGTRHPNQIVLGTSQETVYIPGNLIVDGNVLLGGSTGKHVYMRESQASNAIAEFIQSSPTGDGHKMQSDYPTRVTIGNQTYTSDRRLKNVGEKFTDGLEALKQLDLYHFTFKKDVSKTPHVGVMAQDLQKVFPDAVTKGDDGYLRIRFEDMFYAVINAVKELDAKITAFAADITGMKDRIESQQKLIEAQQKTIEELQKQNEVFSKRLNKLEGREG